MLNKQPVYKPNIIFNFYKSLLSKRLIYSDYSFFEYNSQNDLSFEHNNPLVRIEDFYKIWYSINFGNYILINKNDTDKITKEKSIDLYNAVDNFIVTTYNDFEYNFNFDVDGNINNFIKKSISILLYGYINKDRITDLYYTDYICHQYSDINLLIDIDKNKSNYIVFQMFYHFFLNDYILIVALYYFNEYNIYKSNISKNDVEYTINTKIIKDSLSEILIDFKDFLKINFENYLTLLYNQWMLSKESQYRIWNDAVDKNVKKTKIKEILYSLMNKDKK